MSDKPDCPRCHGDGWVCEDHPRQLMNHADDCGGAGTPCGEPGCPFRTHSTDAEIRQYGRE